jgi:predicted transposase YbfD/YdcC
MEVSMAARSKNLLVHLASLPDPRERRGQRHLLLDVLVIGVLATLCGVDEWEGIEDFAVEEEAWLRTFLELPNGVPSHDTFNRIFRMIDVGAFNACFLEWVKALRKKVSKDVVAIDGKTLRGSGDDEQSPLHMVSAWSVENRMVLGQRSVDTKSNEITAIPQLLKVLELKGCIVTIDAMGCQKNIAKEIVAGKADYVLAVKANQEGLHQATQALFARLDAGEAMTHATSESTEKGHGRTAHRKVTTLEAVRVLPEHILFAWPKLETLVRIQSKTRREGKMVEEERFYISTLPAQAAEAIGEAVKSHWGIENQLHWVLDVAFNEDRNRTRKGSAPESGALLRHITLNLLRQDPTKRSISKRRMKAALSREYRMAALMGFNTQAETMPEG